MLKRHRATALLLGLLIFLSIYRGLIYDYPADKPQRNPIDYVCDVMGFSYHYIFLAFDVRHTGIVSDYHARQALRYKPQDTFMRQYVVRGAGEK